MQALQTKVPTLILEEFGRYAAFTLDSWVEKIDCDMASFVV